MEPGKRLVVALVAFSLVTVSLSAQAHPSDSSGLVEREAHAGGDDTYVIALRSDEPFLLKNKSFVKVTGFYDRNETRQDAAALVGIVRYQRSLDCGWCMIRMIGDSIKDASDVRVATDGPVAFSEENDPTTAAYASYTTGFDFSRDAWFPGPAPGANQVTYRIMVSWPDVQSIGVDVHLHFNKEVQVVGEVTDDGGEMRVGDDYQPEQQVDTMPASAMVSGQATVDLPEDGSRMFAIHSPSWFGTSAVGGTVYAETNTLAVGHYGLTTPDGRTKSGFGIAAGSAGGPILVGDPTPGTYTFSVDWQAGVGPQDMYTVAYAGPVP